MGLAEVLMAHTDETCHDRDCGSGFGYHDCDSREERRTGCEHLAAAVLAWLETLAQDEAVLRSCEDAIDQTYDHRDSASCCGGLTWSTTDGESAVATLTAFLAAAKDAR